MLRAADAISRDRRTPVPNPPVPGGWALVGPRGRPEAAGALSGDLRRRRTVEMRAVALEFRG
eukprot:6153430-Alexandrium_andersonii.AAC.1